jgi:hypothetical protein
LSIVQDAKKQVEEHKLIVLSIKKRLFAALIKTNVFLQLRGSQLFLKSINTCFKENFQTVIMGLSMCTVHSTKRQLKQPSTNIVEANMVFPVVATIMERKNEVVQAIQKHL